MWMPEIFILLPYVNLQAKSSIFLSISPFLFAGVTVYTPTYTIDQSEVIVMFPSGAGVEVVERKGYMAARVYLPWTFVVSWLRRISVTTQYSLVSGEIFEK